MEKSGYGEDGEGSFFDGWMGGGWSGCVCGVGGGGVCVVEGGWWVEVVVGGGWWG